MNWGDQMKWMASRVGATGEIRLEGCAPENVPAVFMVAAAYARMTTSGEMALREPWVMGGAGGFEDADVGKNLDKDYDNGLDGRNAGYGLIWDVLSAPYKMIMPSPGLQMCMYGWGSWGKWFTPEFPALVATRLTRHIASLASPETTHVIWWSDALTGSWRLDPAGIGKDCLYAQICNPDNEAKMVTWDERTWIHVVGPANYGSWSED